MNHDDIIRQRLRELRELDASRAPSFQRVLRGRVPGSPHRIPRLAWASAIAVSFIALAMFWWPSERALPEPSPAAIEALEAAVDPVPSDALLAGAGLEDSRALEREIDAMLNL